MFDPSAPHIIILLIVVLLLFGSSRLPGAARSLGKSMHIFRNSVKGVDADDEDNPSAANGTSATYTQATVMPGQPMAGQPMPGQPMPQQQWPASPQLTSQPVTSVPDPVQQAQIDDLQRQLSELQKASAGNGAQDAPPSSQSN
jgi:sec-independent protein translocase protein TatA